MIRSRRLGPRLTPFAVIAFGIVVALVATRGGPRLSPDSITYLSVADHLRHGRGLVDFTDRPFSVFPPLYPLVLAPFGADLWWARAVNVIALAVAGMLFHRLLAGRVRWWLAAAAVLAMVVCQGTVTVVGSAFSEPLFLVVALGAVAVLGGGPTTVRRAAMVGALAGIGFLTRYAGVSLVASVVLAALICAPRDELVMPPPGHARSGADEVGGAWRTRWWAPALTVAATAAAVSGAWLVRDLVVAGQPMGPRWSGGAAEVWHVLLWRPFESIGALFVGDGRIASRTVGMIAVGVLVLGAVIVRRRRPWRPVEVTMVMFGAMSLVVPVVARVLTASDVSPRVVWPALPCVLYAAALAVDAAIDTPAALGWRRSSDVTRRGAIRLAGVVAVGALVWTVGEGIATADRWAQLPGSGDRDVYSPALHDAIDALPAGTLLLTNNPWGVWWQHRSEPTLMAFVRPRAGNSHLPISADELLDRACAGPVVLAWFVGLQNAGEGPRERRPDLLRVVRLRRIREVPGGELFDVAPLDAAGCPDVAAGAGVSG
jgi:hypothetical protein